MIDLKIGFQFLELGNAKITIEIYNALSQVGIIRDNFSYAFTLPYTAQNERVLGSVGKIASTNLHQNDLACQIYLNKTLWATGTLVIEEAGVLEGFKVKINFDFGAFSNEVADKKLKEIYTDANPLVPTDRAQALTTADSNYNYFSVELEWFYLFPPPLATGAVTLFFILRNGTTVATGGITYPVSDMEAVALQLVADFNANPAVNTAFRALYRKNEGAVLNRHIDILPFSPNNTDAWVLQRTEIAFPFPAVNTFINFNLVDEIRPVITPEYTHICFPRIKATDFYGSANDDFLGVLNDYLSGILFQNSISQMAVALPAEPNNYNDYAHCPCLRLFSVITHICKSIGWTWQGELANDTILETLLIYSNYASDQSLQIGQYYFNEHQRTIGFSTLCPDITIKEFFEQLQELFCLYYEFDATNKILYINFKKSVFSTLPTDSLRNKFYPQRETVEKKKTIILKYDDGLNVGTYYPQSASFGTFPKTDTYSMRAGAMPYDTQNPALWLEKGNSPMFGLGETNNRKMYLFFWRGIQSVNGTNRPTAEGIDAYGAGSLSWSYLYANYWEDYINFLLTNKKAEGLIYLELNFVKKGLRSLARQYEHDFLNFIVEKIQCEIDAESDKITAAKIEIRKIGL